MKKPPKPRARAAAPPNRAATGSKNRSERKTKAVRASAAPTQTRGVAKPQPKPKTSEVTQHAGQPGTKTAVIQKLSPEQKTRKPSDPGDSAGVAELQQYRSKVRNRKWMVRGGLLVLVGILAWVLFLSSVFAFSPERLRVTGAASDAMADEVAAVFDSYEGRSLLLLPGSEIRERLYNIDQIAQVEYERDWPRGISVSIIPSTAAIAVPQDDGYAMFDLSGDIMAQESGVSEGVPVVQMDADQVSESFVESLLQLMQNLPASIIENIDSISVSPQYLIEFELNDSAQILWGSTEDLDLKVAVLTEILADLGETTYQRIDLINPQLPAVEVK